MPQIVDSPRVVTPPKQDWDKVPQLTHVNEEMERCRSWSDVLRSELRLKRVKSDKQ